MVSLAITRRQLPASLAMALAPSFREACILPALPARRRGGTSDQNRVPFLHLSMIPRALYVKAKWVSSGFQKTYLTSMMGNLISEDTEIP